jgi:integrase
MAVDELRMSQLLKSVDAVIDAHGLTRINGKVASIRTIEFSRQVLSESCRRLDGLGFLLNDISSLKEKHLDALVRSWHAQGMMNKTMQNQLSRLRIFCGWIGKSEIVRRGGLPAYLPEVEAKSLAVKTYSDESKSWSGRGVNVIEMYQRAKLEDPRLGGMILMGLAFGFRKKENLRIKPWRADFGHELRVDGSVAKNGRFRSIPIDTTTAYGQFQRWALNEVKSLCKKTDTLGWPGLTYKGSENRYYYFMSKLGITKADAGVSGHGLRAEFAENLSLWRGLLPPSLGGSTDQMNKAERKAITNEVSNQLGHDKEHTISAYFSTFRPVVHASGIGTRIGPIMVVDFSLDMFATFYANPAPVKGPNGYRTLTANELAQTTIAALVELPGQDDQNINIARFMQLHPELASRIFTMLNGYGLATQLTSERDDDN